MAKKPVKKFKRPVAKESEKKNERGTVQIQISRREGHKYDSKNISKAITVHEALVTEVYELVDAALFED